MRHLHYLRQRGELSLTWCFILVALFAAGLMAFLFSARYDHNYFSESWNRLTHGAAVQNVQQQVQTAVTTQHGDAGIRKCMVKGRVVYSNVDCPASAGKPELYDSHGIEAPKALPVAAPEADLAKNGTPNAANAQEQARASARDRAIEQATK